MIVFCEVRIRENLGDDKLKISICVTTYQHEKYIEKCLTSMLEQETDFEYEILIGEDGSTDGTREICERIARDNPDKVRLFLNKREDVYYKHGSPTGRANFVQNVKNAKGEFLAFCDGDDYWVSKNKLQKQVEALEESELDIAFHSVYYNEHFTKVRPFISSDKVRHFSCEEVIEQAGSLMPMPSIMIRRIKLLDNIEGIYLGAGAHFYIQVVASFSGGAIWVPGIYSYYLVGSETSIIKNTISKKRNRHNWIGSDVDLMHFLDQMTNGRYHELLKAIIENKVIQAARSDSLTFLGFFYLRNKISEGLGFSAGLQVFFWFVVNFLKLRQLKRKVIG